MLSRPKGPGWVNDTMLIVWGINIQNLVLWPVEDSVLMTMLLLLCAPQSLNVTLINLSQLRVKVG